MSAPRLVARVGVRRQLVVGPILAAAGLASVLINTTRQLGGAVGLAVMATVAAGASSPTAGYDRAFWISAAATVTLAALAGALPGKPKPQQQVTSGEESAEAAMLVAA